jgi:ATP-dependent helicase HrpB
LAGLPGLPIDVVSSEVRAALEAARRAVVEAPPGAGKTTRLPPLLLNEAWCTGQVLVTEPRRIAARLAATRVAQERGGRVGDEVGYRVRLDDKTGPSTRLVFATEALVLRELLSGGDLPHVSAVVLDEIHERSADLDTLLALLRRLQERRPDLRVLAMSATLDAQAVAQFLSNAPVIKSEGRAFPVDVIHLDKPDDRPLELQVRSAVRSRAEDDGDVLVFLPGAGEIRRCAEALGSLPGLEVLALHGEMSVDDQARAVGPRRGARRVILSTNVAESSVTIPGVTTVIDSGLARVARHDAFSGAVRLEVETISQARCIQRAGRAGRVAPGVCLRLFSKGAFEARPKDDVPELLRTDLAELVLLLGAAGLEPEALSWLTPPPASLLAAARAVLEGLGAFDAARNLTPVGRSMAELGTAPRLARVVVESARLGILRTGCEAAALLGQRDLLRQTSFGSGGAGHERGQKTVLSDSDVDLRLAALSEAREARYDASRLRSAGIDGRGAREVAAVASQLERQAKRFRRGGASELAPPTTDAEVERRLAQALFRGFPERVGARKGGGARLVLASGAQAELARESSVQAAALLLCVAADFPRGQQGLAMVRQAVRLEADWLLEWAPDRVEARDELDYDPERDKIDAKSVLSYGKVVLDEGRILATPGRAAGQVLVRAATAKGAAVYDPESHLEALAVRLLLLAEHSPDLLANAPDDVSEFVAAASDASRFALRALEPACELVTSLRELAGVDLAEVVLGQLPSDLRAALARELPETWRLPGGRELRIEYARGRPPMAASRLQDFFSVTQAPRLCRGHLPLQIHLLAPNKRALQVTTDLASFWKNHYPELRGQLMRRYPKHSWPEDGSRATPPPPGKLR